RPGARARLRRLERGAGARLRGRGRSRPGRRRARGRGAQRGRSESPLDGGADVRDGAPAARRRGAGLAAARVQASRQPVGARGAGHGGRGTTMIERVMSDRTVSDKKVVVLGAGMIGSAVAMDLAREGRLRVTVADKSAAALARVAARYGVET